MAEEIGFENGRNSNFQGHVTLTLTLDPAIRHTVVHHSSTSTDIRNFIEIEETFCGRTDGRTDGCTDGRTFFPSNIIRSTFGSRPKKTGKQMRKQSLQLQKAWLKMSGSVRGLPRPGLFEPGKKSSGFWWCFGFRRRRGGRRNSQTTTLLNCD